VRALAWLSALLPGEPPFPEEHDTGLPLEVVASTRSGRSVDETIALRLALLRQAQRYFSERDLEKELGVPRSTLRRMMERMDEIGLSLENCTADELSYVALGAPHGRKRDS
jgi:transcriptional antiterminator